MKAETRQGLRSLGTVITHPERFGDVVGGMIDDDAKNQNLDAIRTTMALTKARAVLSPKFGYMCDMLVGRCLVALDRPMEALPFFERAIEKHPDKGNNKSYATFLINYSHCLYKGLLRHEPTDSERPARQKAVDILTKARTEAPVTAFLFSSVITEVLYKDGKYEEAFPFAEEAIMSYPKRDMNDEFFESYLNRYTLIGRTLANLAIEKLDSEDRDISLRKLYALGQSFCRVFQATESEDAGSDFYLISVLFRNQNLQEYPVEGLKPQPVSS